MNGAWKMIRIWGLGLVMFALRLFQNLNDFDSATGLHTTSWMGIALYVLVAVAGVLAFILTRRESKKKVEFRAHFAAPEKSVVLLLIVGSFLLAAGGMLPVAAAVSKSAGYAAEIFSTMNAAQLAAAVLSVLSCGGFIVLTAQMRRGTVESVVPVLPGMFFAAFWVLSLYLPAAEDPVFARYYLPILASAMAAYAFAEIGGFFRGETKVRNFNFIAEYATILCIAAAAELTAGSLLFAGCALILTALIALQRKVSE